MPLVYDFSFAPEFGGLNAVVTDAAGSEVDGSPLTLNSSGDGSLELGEGTYTATVSNTALALGNAQSVGALNVTASIAAGGGGGGDLSLVAEEYYAEMGSAQDATGPLVLDSFTAGLGFASDLLTGLPAGYYRISAQVECTRPAELHALTFTFETSGDDSASAKQPTISIYPDGTGTVGKNADFQVHIPVNEGAGLQITAASGCVDGTVTPGVLELSYAYFGITRIG